MRKLIRNTSHQKLLKGVNYRTLLRPKEKLYNLVWTFHQYDEDPFPSVPHGHNDEKNLKISLCDGRVYKGTSKKVVGRASKKEMSNLQRNQDFVDFAIKAVRWYKETYPNTPILIPEWIERKMVYRTAYSKQNNITSVCIQIKINLNID